MAERITEECSALAFYGLALDADAIEAFVRTIERWFEEQSSPITHMALTGAGFKTKMTTASAVRSRLERSGFSALSSIDLISALPDARIPVLDHAVAATLLGPSASFALVARSGITRIGSSSFRRVAGELIEIANPSYGIGFTRPHRLGPTMYAIGLSQGLGYTEEDDLEALNITFWNEAEDRRLWEQGLLRDVYKWNFLSVQQLAKPVGRQTLEEWIAQDRRRGAVAPFAGKLHLWEVEEEALDDIRRALWSEGVIFNWAKHLEGAEEHPNAHQVQLRFNA